MIKSEDEANEFTKRYLPNVEVDLVRSKCNDSMTFDEYNQLLSKISGYLNDAFLAGRKVQESQDPQFSFKEVQYILDTFIVEECPQFSTKGNGGSYLHKCMSLMKKGIYAKTKRPDYVVCDDIDEEKLSPEEIKKRIEYISNLKIPFNESSDK